MVDWQSESDLDSIRNSCDVFIIGGFFLYKFKEFFFIPMDILHKWLLETPGSHNKMRPSCHGAWPTRKKKSPSEKVVAPRSWISHHWSNSNQPDCSVLKPGKVSSTILSNPDTIYDIRIWWILLSHILRQDPICIWKHRSGSSLLFLAGTKANRGYRVPVQTSVGQQCWLVSEQDENTLC